MNLTDPSVESLGFVDDIRSPRIGYGPECVGLPGKGLRQKTVWVATHVESVDGLICWDYTLLYSLGL